MLVPVEGELNARMKPMKLADYLNMFSWSQADLAREAEVSTHCVSRALKGERIARRNAQKIVEALDRQFQKQGAKAHIAMGSIRGLQIADLQRKTAKLQHTEKPAATDSSTDEE